MTRVYGKTRDPVNGRGKAFLKIFKRSQKVEGRISAAGKLDIIPSGAYCYVNSTVECPVLVRKMPIFLSERDKRILDAVVQQYIQTAEPVASRTVSKRLEMDLSAATIRNIMADLEEIGLLSQPHTSAGRVPTEQGLRYYVDSLLEVTPISEEEMAAIEQEFSGAGRETELLVKKTSKILSLMSRHIGLVLAPRFSSLLLKQLEFIRLTDRLVLVILISKTGLVQNRIIESDQSFSQEELDRFNRYLNDFLEGLTISEIKTQILEEMQNEKTRFDQMLAQALTLGHKAFEQGLSSDSEDLYIMGQGRLLDYPEFSDNAKTMKAIFDAFEEKGILIHLLDKVMTAKEIQIFIGSEHELAQMHGWTVIASPYSRRSVPIGTLGIMGPTWLDYSRVIPVVDYTAKLLSRILE